MSQSSSVFEQYSGEGVTEFMGERPLYKFKHNYVQYGWSVPWQEAKMMHVKNGVYPHIRQENRLKAGTLPRCTESIRNVRSAINPSSKENLRDSQSWANFDNDRFQKQYLENHG